MGTAGHIDHGKTALVERLTGVNTDRLAEEKRRGITIVLGFAPLQLDSKEILGVVDVPGHERFVKNMVAGAGGMDLVLLVVAADEGVMPQTREHIEICQLLNVKHGIIALTKMDRAGSDLLELAQDDCRSAVLGTFLEKAPMIPCSSITGEGLPELKRALGELAARIGARRASGPAYLPVDRSFSAKGFGNIVTGTLHRGQLRVGDAVNVIPETDGHPIDRPVRIRGLQVFGQAVETAFAGARTAVNLQGVQKEQLCMGQALVTPGSARPTRKLAAHIHHLKSRKNALKSGASVLLHIGTNLVEAKLSLTDRSLGPGERGYGIIRTKANIAALPGARFILRGFDAGLQGGRTVAGGVVLDPEPDKIRLSAPQTRDLLTSLDQLQKWGPKEGRLHHAICLLLKNTGTTGLSLLDLARRLGTTPPSCKEAIEAGDPHAQQALLLDTRAVHKEPLESLAALILEHVAAFHREFPFREGISIAELTTRVGRGVHKDLVEHVTHKLAHAQKLTAHRDLWHLPQHQATHARQEKKAKLIALLHRAQLEPPPIQTLEAESPLKGRPFRELLSALVRSDELIHAAPSIYFEAAAFKHAQAKIIAFIEAHGSISTQEAKKLLNISRKYLIPLLETLDRRGTTIRSKEVRTLPPH